MPQSEADSNPQQDAIVPARPAAAADPAATRERQREPLYTAAAIPTEAAKRAAHAAGTAVPASSSAAAPTHEEARSSSPANGNPIGGSGGTEGGLSRSEEATEADIPNKDRAEMIRSGSGDTHTGEEHPADEPEGGSPAAQDSRESEPATGQPAKKTPSPSRTEHQEPTVNAPEETGPFSSEEDVPKHSSASPLHGTNGGSEPLHQMDAVADASVGVSTTSGRSIRGLRVVAVSIRKFLVPRQSDS